jgi:hypothetical protein
LADVPRCPLNRERDPKTRKEDFTGRREDAKVSGLAGFPLPLHLRVFVFNLSQIGSRIALAHLALATRTVTASVARRDVRVPRDRAGTFEPKLVGKYQRRLEGFDEKGPGAVRARHERPRHPQGHLRDLYGTEVAPELISRVTDAVLDEARAWQSRPPEAIYPIVYIDALFVSVREDGTVKKKAVYIALGTTLEGRREVLGLWGDGRKRRCALLAERPHGAEKQWSPGRLVRLLRRSHRLATSHRGGLRSPKTMAK